MQCYKAFKHVVSVDLSDKNVEDAIMRKGLSMSLFESKNKLINYCFGSSSVNYPPLIET